MDTRTPGVCRLLPVTFTIFLVANTMLLAGPAAADLYKCQLADGSVRFSDEVCADGHAEPLVLRENTPLDSTAERENIAEYNSPAARRQREMRKPAPQVLLIRDSDTAERNARITEKTRKPKKKAKKKQKKKTGKPGKKKAAKTP